MRRNRVWQTDFTRMEITSGSAWWIAPVTDYYAKVCFSATVSTRIAARDAITALETAIRSAEAMMGKTLLEDCTDLVTGEITPVIVVTDNGPCYKSAKFMTFIASRAELRHVAPGTTPPRQTGWSSASTRASNTSTSTATRSPTDSISSTRSLPIATSTTEFAPTNPSV